MSSTTPLLQLPPPGDDEEDGRAPPAPVVTAGDWPEVEVRSLMSRAPDQMLDYLEEHGVHKLGDMRVKDTLLLAAMGETSMLTTGSDERNVDWRQMWHDKLARLAGGKEDKNSGWNKTIEAEAYVVTVKNAAQPDKEGLIHPLLLRYQQNASSMAIFGLPALQAVLNFKWEAYAWRLLLAEFAAFVLWLGGFTLFVLFFQDEDSSLSLRELAATHVGRATITGEVIALVGMAPFLFIEAASVVFYGLGWLSVWNVLDTITFILQFAVTGVHLTRRGVDSTTMNMMAASLYVLLWFRVQYFFRVFRPTRNVFVETLRGVIADTKWFIFFLLLTIWGFAVSFYILYRHDQEQFEEFSTIGRSLVVVFTFLVGGGKYDLFFKSQQPVFSSTLYVLFMFIMSIVLLNLLVGLLTNSLEKVTSSAGLRFLVNRAATIDELEATLPPSIERLFPRSCFPTYIHVLKVDTSTIDVVRVSGIWTNVGMQEGMSLANPEQEASARMDRIESALQRIEEQLSAQRAGGGEKSGGGKGQSAGTEEQGMMSMSAYPS